MNKSARVRVAILHNLPAPYRLHIFDRLLSDSDLDVTIFFTGKPESNRPSWTEGYGIEDSRVKYLPGIGIPFKGRSADRININSGLKKILNWNPDVIVLYSYQEPTNMMLALLSRLRGLPYIICAEVSHVWNQSTLAKASSPLVKMILKNARMLVAGSQSCARFYAFQGADERRIMIVPTFAQYAEISSTAELHADEAVYLRKNLGLEARFVVLFVGRLVEYKGVEELLLAMNEVWQSRDDVALVVIGTGPMKDLVSRQSEMFPDRIVYFESVDYSTLVQLYTASDAHVMPSWHEAYGLVCGEALASGTPSIVTRTSGCSDLIADGENGILIEPRDHHSISQAILSLAQDPELARRLKSKARASVASYTVDRAVSLLKQAILESSNSGNR